MIYDLCFAWNWEYDSDFAQLFENACRNKGLSLLQITPDNLESMVQAARLIPTNGFYLLFNGRKKTLSTALTGSGLRVGLRIR
jgi:hypothetical protein